MASTLTTVAKLGTYLKKTLTTDAAAAAAVSAANALVETHCRRTFASASYTLWHRATGEDSIALPHYPVTALTSVSTAYQTGSSTVTALVANQDYWLENAAAGIEIRRPSHQSPNATAKAPAVQRAARGAAVSRSSTMERQSVGL